MYPKADFTRYRILPDIELPDTSWILDTGKFVSEQISN